MYAIFYVAGWHKRLNSHANGSGLAFYVLVPVLREDGNFVKLQMRLAQEEPYCRDNRKKYVGVQQRLELLWDLYDKGELLTSKFLQ